MIRIVNERPAARPHVATGFSARLRHPPAFAAHRDRSTRPRPPVGLRRRRLRKGTLMDKPVIFLCDHQPEGREQAERELSRRYGDDYQIVSETTPTAALERLAALGSAGREVPIVFCSQYPPGMTGTESQPRPRPSPRVKRALLMDSRRHLLRRHALEALTFARRTTISPALFPPGETFTAVTDASRWAQTHRDLQFVRVVEAVRHARSGARFPRGGGIRHILRRTRPEGRGLRRAVDQKGDVLPVCAAKRTSVEPRRRAGRRSG